MFAALDAFMIGANDVANSFASESSAYALARYRCLISCLLSFGVFQVIDTKASLCGGNDYGILGMLYGIFILVLHLTSRLGWCASGCSCRRHHQERYHLGLLIQRKRRCTDARLCLCTCIILEWV